jgi:hypothetical protein
VTDVGRHFWLVVAIFAVALLSGCSSAQVTAAPAGFSATDQSVQDMNATADNAAAQAAGAPAPARDAAWAAAGQNQTLPETAPKTTIQQRLQILESGCTVVNGPKLQYGLVLRNPNADYGAMYPTLRLTMLDAAGGVVTVKDQTLSMVWPGQTVTYGGEVKTDGHVPAKVKFQIMSPGAKWKPAAQMQPLSYTPMSVRDLNLTRSSSRISFTGRVVNPNKFGVDDYAISIILRDASGRIVAGHTDFADEIGSESEKFFRLDWPRPLPKYAKAEAFAQPWPE